VKSNAAPRNERWVELSDHQYRSLKLLGDIQTHLALAIDYYVKACGVMLPQ